MGKWAEGFAREVSIIYTRLIFLIYNTVRFIKPYKNPNVCQRLLFRQFYTIVVGETLLFLCKNEEKGLKNCMGFFKYHSIKSNISNTKDQRECLCIVASY